MNAGFCKVSITPPLGTRMFGWADRDQASGCISIHDPIFVRALYLENGNERALILSYDFCFVGRAEADRIKGAVGRDLDMRPRQIMVVATHNHAGPAFGSWGGALPNVRYIDDVVAATRQAVAQARAGNRAVRVQAGMGRSALPRSRRRIENGRIRNAPNRDGIVCDALPVCKLVDHEGRPVCILFSCAAHPVIYRGHKISAEYPGLACDLIDAHIGGACALFLQGTAGDSRPSVIDAGENWNWHNTYEHVERAAKTIASETIALINGGLQDITPALRTTLIETHWPLEPAPTQAELRQIAKSDGDHSNDVVRRKWAQDQLYQLETHGKLPTSCSVLVQYIQLGIGLQIVATEGEPVSDHGLHMLRAFEGVTFPLGYANGEAAYLPSSRMLPEGGYEVDSYWEYGLPAGLAPGMEQVMQEAFDHFLARNANGSPVGAKVSRRVLKSQANTVSLCFPRGP